MEIEEEMTGPKKPVPFPISREQILNIIETKIEEQEARAFTSIAYLTAGRLCEIVGSEKKQTNGITINDLEQDKETQTLVVRLFTEKNRIAPIRKLPISYATEIEKKILLHFTNYAKERKLENANKLFTLNKDAIQYRLAKVKIPLDALENSDTPTQRRVTHIRDWPLHPHYMRHCRLTHLVEIYGYNAFQLMTFAGWTNLNPAMTYLKLNWKSLAKPFQETQQINSSSTQNSVGGAIQ